MTGIRDDPALLAAMLKDMETQDPATVATPYWQPYVSRVAAALKSDGLSAFRSSWAISKGYGDPILSGPRDLTNRPLELLAFRILRSVPVLNRLVRAYEIIVRWNIDHARAGQARFYRLLLCDLKQGLFADGIPDTMVGHPGEWVEIGGERYAPLYLELAHRLQLASTRMPLASLTSYCEIGAGFGGSVHLLVETCPAVRKVLLVDIPPMLYVQTQYLRSFYGTAVRAYDETIGSEAISFSDDDRLEIIPIAPWQIDQVEGIRVDLFWNAASFQEMEPSIVRRYAEFASQLTPDWVYIYTMAEGLPSDHHLQERSVSQRTIAEAFAPVAELVAIDDPLEAYAEMMVHLVGKSSNSR